MAPIKYARFDGKIIMVGFGSIGRGALALIERHIDFARDKLLVIDPGNQSAERLELLGVPSLQAALTPGNYREILEPHMRQGPGFLLNLAVDVSSVDLMHLCRCFRYMYLDTVTEPWPGFYFGHDLTEAQRTNYSLREQVRDLKRRFPGSPTAVSCCGANPGMVSWLLKEALTLLADGRGGPRAPPDHREGWGRLMQGLGIKGVQIAERDAQVTANRKPKGTFVNSWSVDGFLSEAFQPAELGWGSHETRLPSGGHEFAFGPGCAIWMESLGARTRVRSWCPSFGPQLGFLITHNEAISTADYYTLGSGPSPEFRPTCCYAYHPSDDTILSLHEIEGLGRLPEAKHIMTPEDVVSGGDELGVLLYGPSRSFWYGSRLLTAEAHVLAPGQTATTLQVTSGVLAAMIWAIENPWEGIVEAEEMDHLRCLEIQRPYLGSVEGHFTDWSPVGQALVNRPRNTSQDWAFLDFLVT